jgi:3-dehydroquinate synthase II
LDRARQRGFVRFVLLSEDSAIARPGEVLYYRENNHLEIGEAGYRTQSLEITDVATPTELDAVIERARGSGVAVVRWVGDRIIPLENAVAARGNRFDVWVVTDRVSELPAALGALEHGADRVILEIHHLGALDAVENELDIVHIPVGGWELVPVHRLLASGVGDRVIVDTTSLLKPTEGLLVGSAAAFLLHVASEAVGSKFTRPRPFRVNAGSAHSYTLMADGSTRYLSELVPGDAVLVADPKGSFRSVRVGRLKTERRPLRMVEVLHAERTYTLFLQDAETVRLSTDAGPVATTALSVGTRVYGLTLPAARHLGLAIEETIDER